MPDLPLHDPDAEVLEDPTAYDPSTEDDATAPHPSIEGEHLEDHPGVEAVELDEEHHAAHDAHDAAEHPVEHPSWVLVPLAIGLVFGAVLLLVFGIGV